MSPRRGHAAGEDRGQETRGDLRRKGLRLLFWVLAGSLAFNSIFGDMGLVQGIRQRRAAARLRREVEALRRENARLVADIRGLRQDPYRIETIAREELGLSRPGEIIFLFQSPEASLPPQDEAPPPTGSSQAPAGASPTGPGDTAHP